MTVDRWLADLEHRHLSTLTFSEVARALRALSSAYVERRHVVSGGATLGTTGKRAAFALFYAPLHFLAVRHAVSALGLHSPPPTHILDLGCGTGAAGAAWSSLCDSRPSVTGVDVHPWAVAEARHTYRDVGIAGTAKVGRIERIAPQRPGTGIVAAYVLNELPASTRVEVTTRLLDMVRAGSTLLVIEPIATRLVPWWPSLVAAATDLGGRADEWRVPIERPDIVRRLDTAVGLDHRTLTFRSLLVPASATAPRPPR